jgi:uncharacterized protein
MPTPAIAAAARDLTDAEFAELDELLANTPEPLQPVDAVMLDGFLCGVLVQPKLLTTDDWLPFVFDFDGHSLPSDTKKDWEARTTELILRRHAALHRAMEEDGWFDPLVLEMDDEATTVGETPAPNEAAPESTPPASETAADSDEATPEQVDAALAGLSPISQSLMPWVAGFQHAAICFPELGETPDDAVMTALARLYRHLPAETQEERDTVALLDKEHPLATLDDAMEDLVMAVADLYDLTRDARYRVDTIRRDAPKVGRNDPCPCGSGKKFKQCHGKTA